MLLAARAALAERQNQNLAQTIANLQTILSRSLASQPEMSWTKLERGYARTDMVDVKVGERPNLINYLPARPGWFARLIPGYKQRTDRAASIALAAFQADLDMYNEAVRAREWHDRRNDNLVETRRAQIKTLRETYCRAIPEAVSGFMTLVFDWHPYAPEIPTIHRATFQDTSRHLIVEIDLPSMDIIVPTIECHKVSRTTGDITDVQKSLKERQSLYTSVIAQAVLKRLYEVFTADVDSVIAVVSISAFVETINPSTGRKTRPCLVSVRTTRDEFAALDLKHVEPSLCLKGLKASVSRSPSELAPVKPVTDFDMNDPRFIAHSDVLSTLDARANLMELTPGEFENLITNLFQRMGLETRLTQASRDGGVDCVAFDPHPVIGGKVIVQAKRYKNTVGVSAVRDLFGTMHNEGATKGILVTTSGYGKATYEFSEGKPIKLLTGQELLYLLKQHAGIDAKIEMPDDWRDDAGQTN